MNKSILQQFQHIWRNQRFDCPEKNVGQVGNKYRAWKIWQKFEVFVMKSPGLFFDFDAKFNKHKCIADQTIQHCAPQIF